MFTVSPYHLNKRPLSQTLDWWIIGCYLFLVFFGLLNIYSYVQGSEFAQMLDWGNRSGKQFVWIMSSLAVAVVILFVLPPRLYETAAPLLYGITFVLLVAVIFIGSSVKGSHSWFSLGPMSFQPAEISKITTSLMLAAYMSRGSYKMRGKSFWITALLILLPMLTIVAEKETGSALVYIGFIFMLYREGLSGWLIAILGLVIMLFILSVTTSVFTSLFVLLILVTMFDTAQSEHFRWWLVIAVPVFVGTAFIPDEYRTYVVVAESVLYCLWSMRMAFRNRRHSFRWATAIVLVCGMVFIFSANFIFENVLKGYQRDRIEILLGMKDDLKGVGYNVHQSKIAIGSGGFTGKGFCQGMLTAHGFVPEQSTDFIFCTVGEEWGFLGCLTVILVYGLLIFRIVIDSEQSREAFTRIYGYCLAGCLFMHLFINVGMTLGIMPVIGIPLPFMSYGGSSMWAFTIMLFIFVALVKNERKFF